MSKLSRAKRLIGKTVDVRGTKFLVQDVLWIKAGGAVCRGAAGKILIHSEAEKKAAFDRIKNADFEDRPEMWPGEVYLGGATTQGLHFVTTAYGVETLVKVPSRIRQKDLV